MAILIKRIELLTLNSDQSHLLVSVTHGRHDSRDVWLAKDVIDVDVGALQGEVQDQGRVESKID